MPSISLWFYIQVTSAIVESWIIAHLFHFSEVQKKAQAELDAVVGNGRLPNFNDQPQLPYINAVVTEVLRWNSVAPTGWLSASVQVGLYLNSISQVCPILPSRTVSSLVISFPKGP
jgi:hypothetical protein